MNVYFKAVSLLKSRSKQPTKTVPLLLIPGNNATACNNPIKMASKYVISLSSLDPFIFFIIKSANAVIKNANPTIFWCC